MGDGKEDYRLKEAVKEKIQNHDYEGARNLIIETPDAFSTLDNAIEMLNLCNILCAAKLELPGSGINWYWILQLFPTSETSDIESQYRKLASLLYRIKDDFPAIGLALKFIEDAYSVLSDPEKRAEFDSKRDGTWSISGDSNPQVQCNDVMNSDKTVTDEIAVGVVDVDTPSSSRFKRIPYEACDGNGNDRQSTEDLHNELKKKKVCAEEVSTAPILYEEMNSSDESSFTHMSNPSMNIVDTGGSNMGIQNRKHKWSPKDFKPEEVWAVYDGPDAMPRLYVKVTNVVSQTEVCVTFLEPHPMMDVEIQWLEESLPIVCGIFRGGRGMAHMEMSRFSHLVKCERSSKKSFYRIFPQKGEVWAMYKNWNFNWKHSDFIGYQCRVVEILSDFSEEDGISICSLVEVNGRLTFFQKQVHEGFHLTRQLSRLGMLGLSHRIPAFNVLGIKDRGIDIPEGSLHLEPDALPPKFAN